MKVPPETGMNIKCDKANNYNKVICTTYVISMFYRQKEIKLKFQLWFISAEKFRVLRSTIDTDQVAMAHSAVIRKSQQP